MSEEIIVFSPTVNFRVFLAIASDTSLDSTFLQKSQGLRKQEKKKGCNYFLL